MKESNSNDNENNDILLKRKKEIKKEKNKFLEYTKNIAIMIFCAIVSAIEYKVLIAPNVKNAIIILPTGISGIATIVASILRDIFKFDYYTVFSIADNIFNIPSFFIAFYFFGFSFGILTTIYVVISNVLIKLIDFQFVDNLAAQIANVVTYNNSYFQTGGLLTRSILIACCGSITSSLILSINASSGGMSTINYFLAKIKSKSIGHYTIITNTTVAIIFTIFSLLNYGDYVNTILSLVFAAISIILYSVIIDFISPQNKKEQIQVITSEEKIKNITYLLPHGATIISSKGVYSKKNMAILLIVVSKYEISKIIEVIKKNDPNSFIYITKVNQVYGGFFKSEN